MKRMEINCDVAVIGGGIAGICAAIAAARMGTKTVLLQDRPVLGGNASSEIRMHIVGASRHGTKPNRRETGIIEEILLENKYRNPEHSYGIFDTILWEKVHFQENLDLYLNTYVNSLDKKGDKIISVTANQTTTEKELTVFAKQFIDCSGDGLPSFLAGAEYMFGREGKDVFGEKHTIEKSDHVTMGNSIQFRSLDAGRPVPFKRPDWAYDFSNSPWVKNETWEEITSGYFWLEIGGTELNVLDDAELTRDELLKIVYGIWDYIKNHSPKRHEAQNYYLDWVGFLPAKRETRRIVGDYILTETDILENRRFPDAIAYGGWHIDDHNPGGFHARIKEIDYPEAESLKFEGIYTIPYRAIYAKGIDNLFLGGRIISTSHRALASTRVMGTCAVAAEGAGVAAAIAAKRGLSAKDNICNIDEIQQQLLMRGCYIPDIAANDPLDKAQSATVTASSFCDGAEPENVTNGISRPVGESLNMWVSKEAAENQSIFLSWDSEQNLQKMYITLDSNLSVEIMPSLSKWHHVRQSYSVPDTILKDFKIEGFLGGRKVFEKVIEENYQRLVVIPIECCCDKITITALKTHGCETARIQEIRIY